MPVAVPMGCKLSEGAIQALMNGESPPNPILQCLGTKTIAGSGVERIRIILSDGVHSFGTSMLASQLNHLVKEGKLESNAIIRITQYQSSMLQGSKRIVICLNMDIVKSAAEVNGKIGEPVPLTQANLASNATAQNRSSNSLHPQNENARPNSNQYSNTSNSAFSPKPTSRILDAPTTPGGSQARVMPIASLSPYQNRWSIQARVTQKGQIREWKNARGEGKLFNFTVLDESGDIRITCFKEEADKFFDMIEIGKVYYISNGSLKPANQQFNNTSHDYEMTLRRDSMITLCDASDSIAVPKLQYKFKKIKDLEQNINELVDVIGVVKQVDDLSSVMIRSQNREAKVRKFLLVDQSGAEIRVTLWGNEESHEMGWDRKLCPMDKPDISTAKLAEKFDGSSSPVVALKGAKVSDFGNCSLSTTSSTLLSINPDIPESYHLKQWYETGGNTQVTQSLTSSNSTGGGPSMANWKTLADVKSENMGYGEKPDYITAKVTILHCKKDNVLYQACSTDQCNKKVIDLGNGEYRCEKCNKSADTFKYRMILNMHVADEYHSTWVTCFQEQGEILLGVSAQELGEARQEREEKYDAILQKLDFKSYFMKLRVKVDKFNDEERMRVTVVGVSPINSIEYIKKLRSDIEKLQLA